MGNAGTEFAAPQNFAAGAIDIGRRKQTKAEVRYATRLPGMGRVLIEHDHIVTAGSGHLNGGGITKGDLDTKDLLIEAKGAFRVANRKGDVA